MVIFLIKLVPKEESKENQANAALEGKTEGYYYFIFLLNNTVFFIVFFY